VGGRAESKQAHTFTRLYARNPQTAKSDYAGTQERRGINVVDLGRERKCEIASHQRILRVSAINAVAGESRGIAEIFGTTQTILTTSVRTAEPRNSNPASNGQVGGCAVHYFSHNLMARNHPLAQGWKLLIDYVKVCSADSAGADLEKYMAGTHRGLLDFFELQRAH
jgi:hypothetical protein